MDADVVVIGLGSAGSMALWQLAKRGLDVVGVEQFGIGHARGSYAGDSRLFRSAVHEGPRYVPRLRRARELWLELERDSGRHLYDECGALQIGTAGTGGIAKSVASAQQFDLPHEVLDAWDLRARYPQHRVDDDTVAVLDHHAGSLYPEASVLAAVAAAEARGARVLTNAEVIDFDERGGRLEIVTPEVRVSCEKVVVATGSWTLRLRPDLKGFLQILPLSLTWFMPRHPELFTADRFPVFIRDEDGVHLYGTPSHDSYSVKVATEPLWPAIGSPDDVPAFSRADLRRITAWAAEFIPDLNPEPVRYSMHHDLFAPGDLPLVDLDEDTGMLLLTAFSGRGFKFAPVFGEIAADLITGVRNELWDSGFALSSHPR
ncbi:monomeric sarcosine oxidase [Nocardia tenerifensis]|uniref:Monomeric sarcosine oxidase n=1 Tax=Nocardia tenerifensis TaxID=228006 RepID=A0A318KAS9_9NOCA|nr:N-methyl-L-tryptophan oxidase [Nocardia tenerifensis]PXX71448.1 monomeric sarcosine oxidase [Nocardia tenerifensis]